jgi:capsular polysaccharide biosynthesis protein
MSEQALDLRRSIQIVRRHKIVVGIFTALGLLAGVGYATHNQPGLTSSALVVLPPSTHDMATQVVVASSDRVLTGALRSIHPNTSLQALRANIQVKGLTFNVLSISAQGKTAAQAEGTANAVANSYVAYLRTANSAPGRVQARRLEPATMATGSSLSSRLILMGGVGVFLGVLIGAIVALAIDRSDRRLRERDEIADAMRLPVLASIPVRHPSNAAGWTKLLDDYRPGVISAWSMRKALEYLGLADIEAGRDVSLAVVSLSSDRGALALGPQLAVCAATLGIPTELVIGHFDDADVAAALRSACAASPPAQSRRSNRLRVSVGDRGSIDGQMNSALTIVVTVVDARDPQLAGTIRTNATVLGVSAGAATAEQLARVAVSAAADRRQIAGILVADPEKTDQTTGHLPELVRPAERRKPTRMTGASTGTRR